jgi:hypothetical protein
MTGAPEEAKRAFLHSGEFQWYCLRVPAFVELQYAFYNGRQGG